MSKKKQQYQLNEILDLARRLAQGDTLTLAAVDSAEDALSRLDIDLYAVRSPKHWHDDCRLVAALIEQWQLVASSKLKREAKMRAFVRPLYSYLSAVS